MLDESLPKLNMRASNYGKFFRENQKVINSKIREYVSLYLLYP